MYNAKTMKFGKEDCPWHDIFTEEPLRPRPRWDSQRTGIKPYHVLDRGKKGNEILCDGVNRLVPFTNGDTIQIELCSGCANCCPEPVA